jgi:hypothetical protein
MTFSRTDTTGPRSVPPTHTRPLVRARRFPVAARVRVRASPPHRYLDNQNAHFVRLPSSGIFRPFLSLKTTGNGRMRSSPSTSEVE